MAISGIIRGFNATAQIQVIDPADAIRQIEVQNGIVWGEPLQVPHCHEDAPVDIDPEDLIGLGL